MKDFELPENAVAMPSPAGDLQAERRKPAAEVPLQARTPGTDSHLTPAELLLQARTYFGGKAGAGTYQTIINHIRPHDVYMELFAGGAAIMLRKRLASLSVLADLDGMVIQRLLLAHEKLGFRITGVSEGRYRLHVERDSDMYRLSIRKQSYLTVKNTIEFHHAGGRKVCLYLDPPYPHSSRKSSGRNRYRYEFTDGDHEEFLEFVRNLPAGVDILISTYPNEKYRTALADWTLVEFESMTHAGLATEWLFLNYPVPDELHDYQYVGADHRDRLDFSRMKRRWQRKLDKLPAVKRRALLNHLAGEIAEEHVPQC